jgi:molybdopterin-guanine dinucleotide biosynthesis protein B
MNKFILSVIGKSGSGKTTLLKKLIPEMVKRGYKVGTIKHTHHHDFEIDKPGKDSWEHQNAGATSVAISSTKKFAFIKKLDEEIKVKDIISNCFGDVDLILAEGFKEENFPKIEVLRKGISTTPVSQFSLSSPLLLVISDIPYKLPVPVLHSREVHGVADFIEKKMKDFYKKRNIEYLSSMVN